MGMLGMGGNQAAYAGNHRHLILPVASCLLVRHDTLLSRDGTNGMTIPDLQITGLSDRGSMCFQIELSEFE